MTPPATPAAWTPVRAYRDIRYEHSATLLGRYISSHVYDIEQSTGMKIIKKHNAQLLLMPGYEHETS